MHEGKRIGVIIPALDEAVTIGPVVASIDCDLVDWVVVADNGSGDGTAEVARAAGAIVVHEPRRGYGSACLRALREGPPADIYVFLDGDGSDDSADIPLLVTTLHERQVDLVVGSRVLGQCDPGALTPVQRFGNWPTCRLVRWFWGVQYTDLGPLRAVRHEALARLDMADPDYGWTIEMQIKAAQLGLRVCEVPVRYRVRRGGNSKVSGTLLGSWHAGRRILATTFVAKLDEWRHRRTAAVRPTGGRP